MVIEYQMGEMEAMEVIYILNRQANLVHYMTYEELTSWEIMANQAKGQSVMENMGRINSIRFH